MVSGPSHESRSISLTAGRGSAIVDEKIIINWPCTLLGTTNVAEKIYGLIICIDKQLLNIDLIKKNKMEVVFYNFIYFVKNIQKRLKPVTLETNHYNYVCKHKHLINEVCQKNVFQIDFNAETIINCFVKTKIPYISAKQSAFIFHL